MAGRLDQREQVHAPGASVDQLDFRREIPVVPQALQRRDAGAIIAHERVAQPDDEGAARAHSSTNCWSAGTKRPPLMIDDITPVRSSRSARMAR